MTVETAARFRTIPSLTGSAPVLRWDDLPAEPVALFTEWLDTALVSGVPEPLAATLATVDADGMPDARTLILKDVDDRGWAVSGPSSSAKAGQLSARPVAALNLWWQPLVRAVRVRGMVIEASREEREADLAARSAAARADVAAEEWMLWRVRPERVEFWQGSPDRRHTRIVTERVDAAWQLSVTRGGEPLPLPHRA